MLFPNKSVFNRSMIKSLQKTHTCNLIKFELTKVQLFITVNGQCGVRYKEKDVQERTKDIQSD